MIILMALLRPCCVRVSVPAERKVTQVRSPDPPRRVGRSAGFILDSSTPVTGGFIDTPKREVMTLSIHFALVSDTDAVSAREITRVAALDRQVTRDFGPRWGVLATVDPVFSIEDIPVGYWPIVHRDNINAPGALGFHIDRFGQPLALMALTDSWTLTASHEWLEMLADPFSDRMVPGPSKKRGEGRVSYLVEVCDPSEGDEFAYTVNDVLVSDFILPPSTTPWRSKASATASPAPSSARARSSKEATSTGAVDGAGTK